MNALKKISAADRAAINALSVTEFWNPGTSDCTVLPPRKTAGRAGSW